MHNLYVAQCKQGCYNGGICIKPDICGCKSGWTGYNCTTSKQSLILVLNHLLCTYLCTHACAFVFLEIDHLPSMYMYIVVCWEMLAWCIKCNLKVAMSINNSHIILYTPYVT